MIEGLQLQLERLNGSIRDRENRRIVLQGELSASQTGSTPVRGSDQRTIPEESRDLATLKSQLAGLEARYTPSHPDVIRLKTLIESLESKNRSARRFQGIDPSTGNTGQPEIAGRDAPCRNGNQEFEVRGDRVAAQLRTYQKWVEETPRREQELFAQNRDYDRLKEIHSSLLKRKLKRRLL